MLKIISIVVINCTKVDKMILRGLYCKRENQMCLRSQYKHFYVRILTELVVGQSHIFSTTRGLVEP